MLTRSAPTTMAGRWRAIGDDWWFAACGIGLIVGSDFKTRVRDPSSALEGGIDAVIIFELGVYGLVGLYLLNAYGTVPRRIGRVPVHLYLACCFVGLVVLSVSYTPFPQLALVRAGQACVLLGLVVAVGLHGTRAHLHRFAHAYLVLICVSVVYGLVRPSPAVNRLQEGRFTWLAIHPTVSGVLTGVALVLAFSYVLGARRRRPGPNWPVGSYLLVVAIAGGATLASQTRGAVLGGAVALAVTMAASVRRRAIVDFVVGLVVVGVGVALVGGNLIASYFARGGDSEDLATFNSRTDLWGAALDAFLRQPLFGYGVTSSRGIFYEEVGLGGGHNAAVNVAVELGVIGLVVWSAAVVALWVGVRRVPRSGELDVRLDRAMLLGLVAFLMVDGFFFEGPGSVANVASTWLFVCIGWLVVLQRGARGDDMVTQSAAGSGSPPAP